MQPPISTYPHIHTFPGRAGCVYLAQSNNGFFLVDTGFPTDMERLITWLKDNLNAGPDVVKLVVLTHSHFDHTSGVDIIARASGAGIAAHVNARPYLTGQKAMPMTSLRSYYEFLVFLCRNNLPRMKTSEYGKMPWSGVPGFRRAIKSEIAYWLEDGQALPGFPAWTVLHTPGHTDNDICLYNAAEKIMFTGDAVINDKSTVKLNPLLTQDKAALDASREKLQQYEVDYLCPGWGLPVTGKNILAGI